MQPGQSAGCPHFSRKDNDMNSVMNDKVWDEIRDLTNCDDVKSVKVSGRIVEVELDRQILETDFDGKIYGKRRYLIPSCRIKMIVGSTVYTPPLVERIEGAYEDTYPSGFWGNGQVHPHISFTGNACWGNVAGDILLALQSYELVEVVNWIKEFLRTVNVDDIAGAGLSRWPELGANNSIIDTGHDPQKDEYYEGWFHEEALRTYSGKCFDRDGNEIPEEDARGCDACYEMFHYDNMYTVEGEMFCQECYAELAGFCNACEEDFLVEHLNYHDGEYYCDECFQELFDQCANCGGWYRKDEMCEDDEGCLICEDCYDALEENREYPQSEMVTCEVCRKKTDHLTRWTVVDICDECLEQVKGFEKEVEEDESI